MRPITSPPVVAGVMTRSSSVSVGWGSSGTGVGAAVGSGVGVAVGAAGKSALFGATLPETLETSLLHPFFRPLYTDVGSC